MRTVKQRNLPILRFVLIVALVLSSPVLINLARQNADLGGRAAVLSAAINMPDGGLTLLRERFESELYGEKAEAAAANPAAAEAAPRARANSQPEPDAAQSVSEVEPIPAEAAAKPVNPPKIPTEYRAELVSEDFSARGDNSLIKYGAGTIKNDTKKSDESIAEILETKFDLQLTDTAEPQVLLFHTHATESFEKYDTNVYDTRNTWRSTDNNNNMAAVGSAMQQVLEENGIGVLHDTTQHDYPSYNGSYERSAETIQAYLDAYPSIKIVLDLHRDAMERDNQAIVKPVAAIDGQKAAQIMIIAGCDDGTMNMPNWNENLRFAAAFTDKMQERFPGLCRPIYFCYRKYNMDRSNGSLLLEFGSNANTLEEAVYSARLAGQALSELILENMEVE